MSPEANTLPSAEAAGPALGGHFLLASCLGVGTPPAACLSPSACLPVLCKGMLTGDSSLSSL